MNQSEFHHIHYHSQMLNALRPLKCVNYYQLELTIKLSR